MIFVMNIINMIFDLNKILQLFIIWITALENMILKLQAVLNKINIISKHVHSVVQEISSKSISITKNSYAAIVKLTTCNIMMNICIMNLFYAFMKSSEHQSHMIRKECFDCNQKKHIQKNCSMYSFEKIYFLLNLEMNQLTNSVSQINVKINKKSSASFNSKIMKSVLNLIAKHVTISWVSITLIMKLTAKSIMNMNTCINLSEKTWIVFIKKICIVLSVISQITSSSKSENKLF